MGRAQLTFMARPGYDVIMSRLIARILLSIFIFPLGALIYILVFVGMMEFLDHGGGYRARETMAFVLAGAGNWVFMGLYWWALWRKSVAWTGTRLATTALVTGAALVLGLVTGMAASGVGGEFGYFIGSVTTPVLWLVGTVIAWRENAAERAARIANTGGDAVVCTVCGYNLTGLHEARCPECGTRFTLDQLLAGQPRNQTADLRDSSPSAE